MAQLKGKGDVSKMPHSQAAILFQDVSPALMIYV